MLNQSQDPILEALTEIFHVRVRWFSALCFTVFVSKSREMEVPDSSHITPDGLHISFGHFGCFCTLWKCHAFDGKLWNVYRIHPETLISDRPFLILYKHVQEFKKVN